MVQLRLRIVATAYERQHLACMRVQRDQCDLRVNSSLTRGSLLGMEMVYQRVYMLHAFFHGHSRGCL